jgi:hypothetical protein
MRTASKAVNKFRRTSGIFSETSGLEADTYDSGLYGKGTREARSHVHHRRLDTRRRCERLFRGACTSRRRATGFQSGRSFGGSIAALIGGLVADARSVMAKISQHISKLGQAMSQLGQRMGEVGEIIDDIGRALDRFGTGKKFDLNFSSLQKGMDLKFDALSKSIWDDAMPTPGTAGPRSNYRLDNTHTFYDTLNDMFGSGNLPTSWLNNAHSWNNLGNILTGPMTGLKSLLGGGPGAIQDGG